MIGRILAVETSDGTIQTPITPRLAVAFERNRKRSMVLALTQDQKVEDLYWLVWEGQRQAGGGVAPFDKWLETCTSLVAVVEEEDGPLDSNS